MITLRKLRIACAILMLVTSGGVIAQVVADELQSALFRDRLAKAEQGEIEAQESVAFAYMYGLGVARDDDAAVRWYEKAAAAGSALAMSELGGIFGQRRDYARSFHWYSQAAERRYPFAMFRLGVMYEKGWYVAKDGSKALKLYEDAAWQEMLTRKITWRYFIPRVNSSREVSCDRTHGQIWRRQKILPTRKRATLSRNALHPISYPRHSGSRSNGLRKSIGA